MAEASSTTGNGQNPWVDGEVRVSPERADLFYKQLSKKVEHVQQRGSIYSARTKSSRSHGSRSSRSAGSRTSSTVSSRRMDAVADAAALKAKLLYMDKESKKKAELQQKQAELEKIQTMKELDMATAQINALTQLEQGYDSDNASVKSLSIPDGDHHHDSYVQQYVESLPITPVHDLVTTAEVHVEPTTVTQPTSKQPIHPTVSEAPVLQTGTVKREVKHEDINFEQGDFARSLAEQISVARMPPPEPGLFGGDPLQFPTWKAAFETLVEQKGVKPAEKLYYLKRYLTGSAKEAVEGYFLVTPSEAADDSIYIEAKDLLARRYGDPFTVANAFRSKLDNWPKISNKDNLALRKYADFLRQCRAAMKSNACLQVLSDPLQNQRMLAKLPDWMVPRWGRKVANIKKESGQFPSFQAFTEFVVEEANIACDPVTSLQALKRDTSTSETKNSSGKSAKSRVIMSTGASEGKSCLMCQKDHWLDHCPVFKNKDMQDRKAFVKEKRLCFGCLRPGHVSKSCKHRLKCDTCSKRHPTCLHGDIKPSKMPTKSEENDQGVVSSSTAHSGVSHLNDTGNTSKSSMIVPVWVSHCDSPDREMLTYALLDTQSDTTFILDEVCNDLDVEGRAANLSLSTMTAKNYVVECKRIDGLNVKAYNSPLKLTLPPTYTRNIMPANRDHIPTPAMAMKWPHLHRIADSLTPLMDCEVGLLIGYNCSTALAPREVIPPETEEQPYGQRTDLGWGIVGIIDPEKVDAGHIDNIGVSHRVVTRHVPQQLSTNGRKQVQVAVKTSTVKEIITPYQVVKLMEADFSENSDGKSISQEDRQFMNIVHDGIHLRQDHHYEMPLPFRESKSVQLPNNRTQAWHRLMQLKSRMQRQTKYKADYTKFMQGIIDNGYAELVPRDQLDSTNVWYVPHHGVYHARKTDKLRVVFDCSARTDGVALNDLLLQGPDLTNALTGVLTRFRLEHIAIICDIEQMFFQFHVNAEHRDYLRFLWWEDGNLDKEPLEYRMTVHLFGAMSSPGCANFGLKQVAKDNEDKFGSAAARFICDNFYVDDGLISVPTAEEAVTLIKNTKEMCQKGGLRLHKFVSNSKEVMAAVPPADRAEGIKDLDLLKDDLPIERALGIQWCVENDTFHFRIVLKDRPLTKRGILSTICSIYDPLGLLAPILLVGKQILQQMCREGADWDSPLSETLQTRWERWRINLSQLESLEIKRCFKPDNFGEVKKAELHHFSDASTQGYGQCSYLRLVNQQNQVHCSLLMGKARVTPLKTVTIPRLELTAAVVSVKVSNFLKRELELTQDAEEFFWTDSKVVLGYIRNESRRFHVFVANRVQQIRDYTDPMQWMFVRTEENPADDASRGITPHELMTTSKWLSGPNFLWNEEIPEKEATDSEIVLSTDDPEVKKTTALATCADEPPGCLKPDRLEYFSSWIKARRAVANCLSIRALLMARVMKKQNTEGQSRDTETPKLPASYCSRSQPS